MAKFKLSDITAGHDQVFDMIVKVMRMRSMNADKLGRKLVRYPADKFFPYHIEVHEIGMTLRNEHEVTILPI